MKTTKLEFRNEKGELLSARLELPIDQKPHNFALFAHCFTCSKNLSAVGNISRALTMAGFGVLRFDFTGLGESEGDFEDTTFSSNVEDLVCAASYLEDNYKAPSLLVGHSLGGTAVIFAAGELKQVKAVATIGAPSNPVHVKNLLQNSVEEIRKTGIAEVNIGGRNFTIKKKFLDDINEKNMKSRLSKLDISLLVMHSPQDEIVGIDNASEIYWAAKHPKSFITLDGADHLLMKKNDSGYAGKVIGTWAERYIERDKKSGIKTNRQVAVRLGSDGFTTEIVSGRHELIADEPEKVGGNDFGPSPYQLLSASLGACTAMTLRMYADRKNWSLDQVTVHLDHGKEYVGDAEDSENPKSKIDKFQRIIEVSGNLDEEQKNRLLEIADKCPVHRTLYSDVIIETSRKE